MKCQTALRSTYNNKNKMSKSTLCYIKLVQKKFLLLLTLINFNAMAQKNIFPGNQDYDLVILNGRVIDPESKLDAVRNIGIKNGIIETVTTKTLKGRKIINAKDLVVSPGFIDLHQHGQDAENYRVKAMDGVTTALELETGTADVDRWYAEREGKALINYGVSAGHMPIRMKVMHDSGKSVPVGSAANNIASQTELEQIKQQIEHGLKRGAVAVGFIIAFTPAASRWEIIEVFRVAVKYNATCHVHIRFDDEREPNSNIQALEEVIAAAAIRGFTARSSYT